MSAATSIALRARQSPAKPHHGKFIYLFSNLHTNQVIYSLEQVIHTLRQERVLLKQLTFYGKKTVPTKLRKDLWKPFAIVTFGNAADGLEVFRLLREYRSVRDYAWTFAPTPTDAALIAPQTSAAEAESNTEEDSGTESEMDGKGAENVDGDKKEVTPAASEADEKSKDSDTEKKGAQAVPHRYDEPIKHYAYMPSTKERAKLLMDQRATSVADLSAVIRRRFSPDLSKPTKVQRQAQKLWKGVFRAWLTTEEEVKKLEAEKEEIVAILSTANLAYAASRNKAKFATENARRRQNNKHLREVSHRLRDIQLGKQAMRFFSGAKVEEKLRKRWPNQLKWLVQFKLDQRRKAGRKVLENWNPQDAQAKREQRDTRRPEHWTLNDKYDNSSIPHIVHKRDRIALGRPKIPKGSSQEEIERIQREYYYNADRREALGLEENSVLIQWADLSNAQFAADWHETVVHDIIKDQWTLRTEERLRKAERPEKEAEVKKRRGRKKRLVQTSNKFMHETPLNEAGKSIEPPKGWDKWNPMAWLRGAKGGLDARV